MKLRNYQDFEDTLATNFPNPEWSEGLKALWYDAKGDWNASHDIAQEMHDQLGSWIHAYLHRKEGDEFNAGYWYRKAKRPFSNLSLEAERQEIVKFLLD